MSQAALGKAAGGIESSRISRIEKGYCDLPKEEAEALALALGVSLHVLEGRPPSPSPSASPSRSPSPSASASASPPPPPPPVTILEDDLSFPANFKKMPDLTLLRRDPAVKAALTTELAFATKVLHTSKVPAATWREWRAFEKQAQDILRVDTHAS